MQKLLLPLFFAALASCHQKDNSRAIEQYLNHIPFDKDVIALLPYYDSIKNIAIANMDTIFSFRNSRNIVDYSDGSGHIERRQEDNSEYEFSYDFEKGKFLDYMSNNDMPEFVGKKLSVYFERIGKNNIGNFTLETDSTVQFAFEGIEDKNLNIEGGHLLIWKRVYAENISQTLFTKDTVIAPGWTYNIWVEKLPDDGWPR